MSGELSFGPIRKPARGGASQPMHPGDRRGTPMTGRIVRLLVGQGYGYIRLRDHREIFFHRSDVAEGTRFNDLDVGVTVSFELLEDAISGARAVHVRVRGREKQP